MALERCKICKILIIKTYVITRDFATPPGKMHSAALVFMMVLISVVLSAIFKGAGNFELYNLSFDPWKSMQKQGQQDPLKSLNIWGQYLN